MESLIFFLNEENLLDASKKHSVSSRGLTVMSLIVKSLNKNPQTPLPEQMTVDVMAIKAAEIASGGKETFRAEDAAELVKNGYISELKIKSSTQALTTLNPNEFIKNYRLMQILQELKNLNEQKREVTKK